MATRFYFHSAAPSGGTFPSAEQGALTANTFLEPTSTNHSMDTTIGTSMVTINNDGDTDFGVGNVYISRWVSQPIYQSSIAANTWTYSFAAKEEGLQQNYPVSGSNQPVRINIYVWRPSTGAKVGTILDGNTASTVDEATSANIIRGSTVTFSGASVGSVQNGDVIIFEAWATGVNILTTVFMSYYYDGTVVTTTDGTVSNHATFIETPENLILTEPLPPGDVYGKVINFTKDSTTGAHQQVITGVGFQPKGAIFLSGMQTATGTSADANMMIGISDGTNNKCVAMSDNDGAATSASSSTLNSTNCIVMLKDGSTTIDSAGDVDSFDTDGLTIGWNSASATQFLISAFLFGGDGITNVKVTKHDCPSVVAGNDSYTGIGFKSHMLFFLWSRTGAAEANSAGTGAQVGFGLARSNTEQASTFVVAEHAQGTSDTYRWFSNTMPIEIQSVVSGGTLDYDPGSFVSIDSDGFTVANSTSANSSTDFFSLAIRGGNWDCGGITQRSGTGTQNVTVTSDLDPGVIMLGGNGMTTSLAQGNAASAQGRMSIGMGDTDNNCAAVFLGTTDAQTTAEIAKTVISNQKIIVQATEASGSVTTNAECHMSAHQAGQFTLNWTTADTTLRLMWFVALASTIPAPVVPIDMTQVSAVTFANRFVTKV